MSALTKIALSMYSYWNGMDNCSITTGLRFLFLRQPMFEMSAATEHHRALVISQQRYRPPVRIVHGGLVKLELTQHTTEGEGQVVLSENFLCRAKCQHRAVDEHDLVAELRHGTEIVRGDEHDVPSLSQFTKQIDDCRLGFHVHPGKWLIEQDDPPFLRESAGQEDALLLAPGKLADLAVPEVPHLHSLKTLRTSRLSSARGVRRKFMKP